MEQHLIRRGTIVSNNSHHPPQCLSSYTTLESLLQKCMNCGFQTSVGCNMLTVWDTLINPVYQKIALSVEPLDELEEWNLLMKHYVFIVASGNRSSSSSSKSTDTDEYKVESCISTLEEMFCKVGNDSILGFQQGHCLCYKK